MKNTLLVLFGVILFHFLTVNAVEKKSIHHQYCVIGGGPSGLQIGYFLQTVGRDYVIFEKGSSAGTFYTKYPIHRTLISINKRFTGKTNKEFNFRHDWNSLISHDESLLMTKYTKEFFPAADVLVKYLNDFATKLGLNVQYSTEIANLIKRKDGVFDMNDQSNTTYTCQFVIVATGVAVPNHVEFTGSEYTQSYDNLTLDLEDYEGQSVLIIGRGNSAFEVAQHIMPATNVIHMMGRSRVKLAWATHYVGDLRAINDGLLDTYQLKSLDGIFEGPVESIQVYKSKVDGRLYLRAETYEENDATREGYDRIIRCLGFKFDDSIFHADMPVRHCKGKKKKYPFIRYTYEAMEVRDLYFTGAIAHSLDYRKSAGAFIHGYRYSARTLHRYLEWKNHGIKWPSLHFNNLVDLIPHVLKRINEASDIYQMFGEFCEAIIYNEQLTEATYLEAIPCAIGSNLRHFTGHKTPGAVMFVAMEYGKNFSGPGNDPFKENRATGDAEEAHLSNFLHPVLYHFNSLYTHKDYLNRPEKWIFPVPDRILHLVEDFTTKFDSSVVHILQLRRFIEANTGHDLRLFYAKHCMMLAMTKTTVPIGCRNFENSPSSNLLTTNTELESQLSIMPAHILPFTVL